ncbi:hypothetical protein AM231_09340 [Paenibacillus solani]|uniref:Uncharacterized protein n=1 Tax=Paenibacillus solani TaxID=1705565 RepID=A0A0M1P4T9_9BACL|nr:hypothetical protein AM231_09340 [Paenibacillus solani]
MFPYSQRTRTNGTTYVPARVFAEVFEVQRFGPNKNEMQPLRSVSSGIYPYRAAQVLENE